MSMETCSLCKRDRKSRCTSQGEEQEEEQEAAASSKSIRNRKIYSTIPLTHSFSRFRERNDAYEVQPVSNRKSSVRSPSLMQHGVDLIPLFHPELFWCRVSSDALPVEQEDDLLEVE